MSLKTNQKKLLEEYSKLPAFDQQLLTVFSLVYFEIFQTNLLAILNNPAFSKFGHGDIRIDVLKQQLEKLKGLSLIILVPGKGYRCNPEIVELVTRESIKQGYFNTVADMILVSARNNNFPTGKDFFSLVRIALYKKEKNLLEEVEKIQEKLYFFSRSDNYVFSISDVLNILNNPFDIEFIESFNFPDEHLISFFEHTLVESVQDSIPNPEVIEYILVLARKKDKRIRPLMVDLICEHLILQGRFLESKEINELHKKREGIPFQFIDGVLSFVQGNIEQAFSALNAGIDEMKRRENKKVYILSSFKSILYFFILLKNGETDNYALASDYSAKIAKNKGHLYSAAFQSLNGLCQFVSGLERDPNRLSLGYYNKVYPNFWESFVFGLVLLWTNPDYADKTIPALARNLSFAKTAGYKWMEMQLLDLIAKIGKTESMDALKLKKELNSFYISEIIEKKAEWKIILSALTTIKSKTTKANKDLPDTKRLAWFIHYDKKRQVCIGIQPVEQSYSQKTGWSDGKNVALKRLKNESNKIPFLSEQDMLVIPYIKVYSAGYYGGTEYSFDKDALIELVGHPNLFWSDTKTRFDLEKGEPELSVAEENTTMIKLTLHPSTITEDEKFTLFLETPSRLKIIVFSPEHRQIAKILGGGSLKIPTSAKEQVIQAITNLSSSILIQSEIGGLESQIESVESLTTPYLHLLPNGAGLKLTAFCRPFAGKGPYYKPGKGGKSLIAEIEGKKLRTNRNLEEEESRLTELLRLCPTLYSSSSESEHEWILEDIETCLEVLFELQTVAEKAIIEWPEGEKFKLKKQADISRFHIGIKKDNDWFSVNGSLDLGDKQVMEMQTLLELLDQTPGRFIKLDDGGFLALTDTFRKQLDELRAYSEPTKDGFRFSPLIAPLIEEMTSQVGSLKADKAWKAQVEKLEELKDFKPELPKNFQATLRDYQREGFEWLARLSYWGVGACLADDMGLGKTIQSLAILLTRASSGPSLVIAPSSVCMNWHTESMRFAPTLNTIQFGGKHRESLIKELKPYDLVVCSYGMIQQEDVAETLKSVQWQVVILDEAQAIKNMSTKRSQAVMSLQAGFRLLTTGTPIENHLGELWNLFRFLNPGLLGSLERFNQRFATPIEKNKNKTARHQLKKLIQPFILRRLKNQVLDELPEKTDITLQIELSEKEKAFYEALRLNAIKKLNNKDVPAGQKHLQILAEIMKLRRACCNVKLVEDKIDLPSSKFNAFTEILEELLENKHKALVFSQFVDHLAILKKYLEENKIPFQYLDGSTSMKERKLRVDAFQQGEGEVFLISLKAGGTGLNLTAADYVIHMDPWWNPAVEDQASDRAHRMGQKRPVTVYRLVAKDTIEEKIVDLHKHKRDLADSLLEETDMSGKISADELLNLLKEG